MKRALILLLIFANAISCTACSFAKPISFALKNGTSVTVELDADGYSNIRLTKDSPENFSIKPIRNDATSLWRDAICEGQFMPKAEYDLIYINELVPSTLSNAGIRVDGENAEAVSVNGYEGTVYKTSIDHAYYAVYVLNLNDDTVVIFDVLADTEETFASRTDIVNHLEVSIS